MLTQYGEKMNHKRPLPEHPRPQMVRDSYLNLNGPWQYAITQSGERPAGWQGTITVPYCPESELSGVGRVLRPEDFLWYRREFSLPYGFMRGRLLLHFGAVEQNCVVWVNGREAGRHSGGYLPFCFDVTDLLAEGAQEILVMATDPTDTAPFSRGRQKLLHGGQWHGPVSGIWQTVWLESVPQRYISGLRITPLYDAGEVELLVEGANGPLNGRVQLFAKSTFVAGGDFISGKPLRLKMPGFLSWSPRMPFLYTLMFTAGEDAVESYFGMRKFSVEPDAEGVPRLFLNNKPFFGKGVVDQGLFCDGLYTPPSYAAMRDDLRYARECGFNMVRKHGKIEPLRWYHLCDTMGLLVWQDLPAGGGEVKQTRWECLRERLFESRTPRKDDAYARFGREDAEGRTAFLRDMAETAAVLCNTPSLGVWGIFQHGQGQFDAAQAAALLKSLDGARLVDHADGLFDQGGGDIAGIYLLNDKRQPQLPKSGGARAAVLAETGGFGLAAPDAVTDAPCAAKLLGSREQLAMSIAKLYQDFLAPLSRQGLSGFFYLQLTDAEDEVSGLITYDRRRRKVHQRGLATLNEMLPR